MKENSLLATSAQRTQEFSNKLEDTTAEAADDTVDAITTDNELKLNNTNTASDLAPFIAVE